MSQSSESSSIYNQLNMLALYGTKKQTMQLDSIQRRATRFVNNNFYDREPGSVKAMISDLGWESLEQRREKTRAILMYKIAINITYSSRCKN
jgi:hypothetical protein